MSAKLDRSKAFGQVFGVSSHSYEQDGKLFDHEGREVVTTKAKAEEGAGDTAKHVAAAKAAKTAATTKAEEGAGDPQLDAQLNG